MTSIFVLRISFPRLVVSFITSMLMLLSFSVWAIDAQSSFDDILPQWNSSLKFAETTLSSNTIYRSKTRLTLANMRAIKKSAETFSSNANQELLKYQNLLNALGPEPEVNALPEVNEVIEQRVELNQLITLYDGQIKQGAYCYQKNV